MVIKPTTGGYSDGMWPSRLFHECHLYKHVIDTTHVLSSCIDAVASENIMCRLSVCCHVCLHQEFMLINTLLQPKPAATAVQSCTSVVALGY